MAKKYRKPSGSVLSLIRAKYLAESWHGGQWSPLYSFFSSYQRGNKFPWDSAISEIDNTILSGKGSEFLSGKDKREVKSLRKFFEYKRWEEQ